MRLLKKLWLILFTQPAHQQSQIDIGGDHIVF